MYEHLLEEWNNLLTNLTDAVSILKERGIYNDRDKYKLEHLETEKRELKKIANPNYQDGIRLLKATIRAKQMKHLIFFGLLLFGTLFVEIILLESKVITLEEQLKELKNKGVNK